MSRVSGSESGSSRRSSRSFLQNVFHCHSEICRSISCPEGRSFSHPATIVTRPLRWKTVRSFLGSRLRSLGLGFFTISGIISSKNLSASFCSSFKSLVLKRLTLSSNSGKKASLVALLGSFSFFLSSTGSS